MRLLVLSLIFCSQFAAAQAIECSRCVAMEKLLYALQDREANAVSRAVDYLSRVRFSKNRGDRALEIEAFVRLGYLAMKMDKSALASEYFFSAFEEDKVLFREAISKLPADQRRYIFQELKRVDDIFKNGNG